MEWKIVERLRIGRPIKLVREQIINLISKLQFEKHLLVGEHLNSFHLQVNFKLEIFIYFLTTINSLIFHENDFSLFILTLYSHSLSRTELFPGIFLAKSKYHMVI